MSRIEPASSARIQRAIQLARVLDDARQLLPGELGYSSLAKAVEHFPAHRASAQS